MSSGSLRAANSSFLYSQVLFPIAATAQLPISVVDLTCKYPVELFTTFASLSITVLIRLTFKGNLSQSKGNGAQAPFSIWECASTMHRGIEVATTRFSPVFPQKLCPGFIGIDKLRCQCNDITAMDFGFVPAHFRNLDYRSCRNCA